MSAHGMTHAVQAQTPRVYLAGPDVFRRDAATHYAHLQALCAARGLMGLRPCEGEEDDAQACGTRLAQQLYEGNLALIRSCDAVLANLSPFRGPVEPDSGTVFEVGVAVALGKPVAAWMPQAGRAYAERVMQAFPTRTDARGVFWCEADDTWVEGFGEPLNLMLSRSTRLFASIEEALDHLAGQLG